MDGRGGAGVQSIMTNISICTVVMYSLVPLPSIVPLIHHILLPSYEVLIVLMYFFISKEAIFVYFFHKGDPSPSTS